MIVAAPDEFPPASTGNTIMLIAAVARQRDGELFHIAALDGTAFVQGH